MAMKSDRDRGGREADDRKKKYTKFRKDNRCRFCRDKVGDVDYKEIMTLFKLYSRKRSGNCAYHQRSATNAIKRARFLALVPYVGTGAL
jgi:small subunit ribosomal protein S18